MSKKQTIDQLIEDFCKDTASISKALSDFVEKWNPRIGTLDEKDLTKAQLSRIEAATKVFNESLSKVYP